MRTSWLCLFAFPCLILAAACEDSSRPDDDEQASTDAAPHDGGAGSMDAALVPDTGLLAVDAGGFADAAPREDAAVNADATAIEDAMVSVDAAAIEDAGADPDSGVADAGAPDSGPMGCPFPDPMVDGPFASGMPPASANLLLTDTGTNQIYQLALDGQVLGSWPGPAPSIYGVAHDRRTPDGFWVIARDRINMPNLFRVDFAGNITASRNLYNPNGVVKGVDYVLGSVDAQDLLVYATLNTNSLPVIHGLSVSTGLRAFEDWMQQPSNAEWFGSHVQRYACDDAMSLVYWTTRDGVLELREWGQGAATREVPVPGTNAARGVTRTPRGDFYIVDDQNDQVVHVSPQGALLDTFATPGTSPADISYAE